MVVEEGSMVRGEDEQQVVGGQLEVFVEKCQQTANLFD
jgi:hypothetical protein